MTMTHACALCSVALPKNPVREGKHAFCCSGCLTVFTIIGAHDNFKTHPLYQEALKAGVIANPHIEAKEEVVTEEGIKCHLQITGMWCPSCAEAIRLILMRQKGIYNCLVDYATDLAMIRFDPCLISKEQILELIHKMGYQAAEFFSKEKNQMSRSLWVRFAITAFCALNIMMFSYPLYAAHFGVLTEGYDQTLGWLSFALAVPLVSYSAWPIWRRLRVSLKSGLFGMETLIALGVATAFIVSTYNLLQHEPTAIYYDSLSMVLSFVLLGKILETKAKFSAKETLLRLTRFLPNKGYKRVAPDKYAYVPLKEITCGDILLVRAGEKLVLDGVVIEGRGLVDEAIMTGESMPLQKTEGHAVIGGSIVRQGSLVYRVTKEQTDSVLGQILNLIERDLAHKQVSSRLVDQITKYFIPAALTLAAIAFFMGGAIRALTVLLIACPCALGIAVPLALSRLYFHFAENGALVRNRSRISVLGQNPLFVFDKTGTLTEGKFRVLSGLQNLSEAQCAILKAIVSHSHHPIACAIAEAIPSSTTSLEQVAEIVGRGMEASCQGNDYLLGSHRFLQEKGIEAFSYSDSTVVYFVENQTLLAEIHLGDHLRPRLPRVTGVVLSGDSSDLVRSIAKKCGFLWGKGGMDPLQKREEILKLKQKGRPVVMVGDGINDAPAMAVADLGISVVSATDLAVEVSDVLLTTEHLDALPTLCKLVKKSKSIIRQNLFWAFFYNSVGIVLALLGILTPLLAACAMAISSLFVTLNSFRLGVAFKK